MGVDQPWQDHMFSSVEYSVTRLCGMLPGAEQLNDQTVLQDETATGIEAIGRENGEGIF
jgi:hypothetical protein